MEKYIVTDTETTGLDDTDGIVEIAGVSRDGDDLMMYDSLCNPGVPIGVVAKAVHHITEDMLLHAPRPDFALHEMVTQLAGHATGVWMVAHNAAFDRGFIGRLNDSMRDENGWICTYRCAMHIWPDAPGHSNQVLRYWLGVDVDLPSNLYPHRALYDAIVTEAILRKMLERFTLAELAYKTLAPIVLTKVRFGKHKGQEWKDVPRSYLTWVVGQREMDSDVRHTALHYLRGPDRLI